MQLQRRIDLLIDLGKYIQSKQDGWALALQKASHENSWFIPGFIEQAVVNIVEAFLQRDRLKDWATACRLPENNPRPRSVGIIMAGNIPLVGFHDFLCTFISGHQQIIKPSVKDEVLIRHLVTQLYSFDERAKDLVRFSERLKDCDAYIATGSNNSSRYFEYYFGRYPHIIRKNRTSVAVLDGSETKEQLEKLAGDVCLYFGLGCRNVTKIWVPRNYDFLPLLEALKKYSYLSDYHKFRNNYDYRLAIFIINKIFYMTEGTLLLIENDSVFSPIGVLHYEHYDSSAESVIGSLTGNSNLQAIIGRGKTPFGLAQRPGLSDYADGEDIMKFLLAL
jgi:hypothetical protein